VTYERHRLAYDTAVRALEQQERLFGELRTRAGTLLAASSLAISLAAPDAIAPGGSKPLALSTVLAFLLCAGASLYVLVPQRAVAFSPSSDSVRIRLSHLASDTEAYNHLIDRLAYYRASNGAHVKTQILVCQIGTLALAMETVMLAAGFAVNII